MKEEIVTYKTAKLADRKGFDEEIQFYYDEYKKLKPYGIIKAPYQCQLRKWIRDKYDIDIIIKPYKDELTLKTTSYKGEVWNKYGAIEHIAEDTTYEKVLEIELQKALKLIN